MKQIHTLFIIALSVLALTSCRDDFDIKTVKAEPRVILYCMPTAGDTTAIQLMRSLPVNQTGQVVPIDGARISYTVNGQPATVIAEGNGRVIVPISAGIPNISLFLYPHQIKQFMCWRASKFCLPNAQGPH